MATKKHVHVVPHNGKWATRTAGSTRVGGTYDTQSDAIDAGRGQAQRNRLELVIHRRNGEIRDKDSYGNDPNPPRDTKF